MIIIVVTQRSQNQMMKTRKRNTIAIMMKKVRLMIINFLFQILVKLQVKLPHSDLRALLKKIGKAKIRLERVYPNKKQLMIKLIMGLKKNSTL